MKIRGLLVLLVEKELKSLEPFCKCQYFHYFPIFNLIRVTEWVTPILSKRI